MYDPYWGRMQGYPQQPVQMQPVQQLIRVTGLEGAKAYQMAANSTAALFDAGEDMMYIKSTDGAGFPTIRVFRFEPVEQVAQVQNDYVTRKEFEELKEAIRNGKQPVREE